ncbi:hypothetical protein ONS95_000920 [Cadophora gregata]|uniref:uncharacterized protein n=1 Tax=Cadophora gregata TaxID=51156 RepID=UPI0026DD949E|nr:uncharacterized protein ONS95_000920 [Cadophora gregata]KAK0128977.1 hypothetical protein ONS95_000920 [Cadophora gregata]
MSSHIEYQRFHRGESCTEEGCRARKFYIEDGKKFCQTGHEQAGFTQTQQDEDDWNAQGKRSRKRKEERERVETILNGREARELYLQCYQLILWKQCHWLVTDLGLPEDLRIIIRDLWELRLMVLELPRDEKSGYGSGTGTMLFSSASEGNNTDTDGMTHQSIGSRRSRTSVMMGEKLPRLIGTLALCYLGTLMLNVPISIGDFHKWALHGRIIYNRAIKEVPSEMRSKLPAHFHAALEIRAPLDGMKLHNSIAQLAEFFNIEYEMQFPKLNVPLLLFRYMKELCLPVELYPAIRRLETLLQVDFTYPTVHNTARRGTAHPEIQLMSLIVIATKLAHPFDNVDRTPESYSDPSVVKIDWSQWTKATAQESLRCVEKGEVFKVTDANVWNMSARKLDDYLDWYENTWIDNRDAKISEQILQIFPMYKSSPHPRKDNSHHEDATARLRSMQQTLILQEPRPIEGDSGCGEVLRAGELYKRYRMDEELPDEASAFFELAASIVCISSEQLLRNVFRLEVHLETWRLADIRRRSLLESENG